MYQSSNNTYTICNIINKLYKMVYVDIYICNYNNGVIIQVQYTNTHANDSIMYTI